MRLKLTLEAFLMVQKSPISKLQSQFEIEMERVLAQAKRPGLFRGTHYIRVVEAQWTERSLPKPEIHGSNLNIGKTFIDLSANCNLLRKDENKENERGCFLKENFDEAWHTKTFQSLSRWSFHQDFLYNFHPPTLFTAQRWRDGRFNLSPVLCSPEVEPRLRNLPKARVRPTPRRSRAWGRAKASTCFKPSRSGSQRPEESPWKGQQVSHKLSLLDLKATA